MLRRNRIRSRGRNRRQKSWHGRRETLDQFVARRTADFGEIRITGGRFKGQKIKTPGAGAHPMGSRERLALFNMLDGLLQYNFILDAYAGSGALGIEALSRGANFVLFLDDDFLTVDLINANLDRLGVQNMAGGAICKDVLEVIPEATDRFGIVFADPPYDEYKPKMITVMANVVAPGGVLVASTPVDPPKIKGMKIVKHKKYARAHLTIYQWKDWDGEDSWDEREWDEIDEKEIEPAD